jgi:TldD protein
MSPIAVTDRLFFERTDLDRSAMSGFVAEALCAADDGELFLEYRQHEALTMEDGRIRKAAYDLAQGFGLRAINGEATAYAHGSSLTTEALRRAARTIRSALSAGGDHAIDTGGVGTNQVRYSSHNPIERLDFAVKTALLTDLDAYARRLDERVCQVIAALSAEWQAIQIIRANGQCVADIRPLVRLSVTVVVEKDGRMETGTWGLGGRYMADRLIQSETWQAAVNEALRQALVNLEAVPAPAGEMTVVLGPGWPGILLHEAIGHGLEGDFNRKKTSAFAGLLGERVASPGVSVVDDATLTDRRGSLAIDDEGTAGQRTALIEKGVLRGFMQDRMNARLMGSAPTGNGRRQSFAHRPMPRMTNTYMLAGDTDPGEIVESVDKGLLAVAFGGGQVDITSGKFVFSCTEAYRIDGGKVGAPVKGATLIGNGPDVLTRVSLVGNDLVLDPGVGTCGKDGQSVPVGVGQPTLRIDGLTVGGTQV